MNNTAQTPKVSIIVPVYQVEMYLERAVDSLLAQTLKEKEILLVDDGSEDASPALCDRYAREYPGLVQVIHKENEGLGPARNTGVRAAAGEYIAFVDSDDTVEPTMYEEMYEKAVQDDCDIVMCDVRIRYVEEERETVSVTYPRREIDLPDYIANGNNITYSVNKLFRRSIWAENAYERMLFEDIALIPALMTRYQRVGYVQKPFYTYYRRANTISTSETGAMADIVQAFRYFLGRCNPAYREEAVYCAARQLYWNMTSSRPLFQADFIGLLKEYKKDFLLNPYLGRDKETRKLLAFLDREVIPDNLICVHFSGPVPEAYREEVRRDFPRARLLDADRSAFPADRLPPSVRLALEQGRTAYAEEYAALRLLYEEGGIVLAPDRRASLGLKRLRLNRVFFGFEDAEAITTGCFGALPGHYVIQALLETYEADTVYNQMFLPLGDRIRDFLMIHFGLKPNGRSQLLRQEVQVYLPSVLAYDMKDGDNCCKNASFPVPEGFEAVRDGVLRLWSDRLLENWTLYKKERDKKPAGANAPDKAAPPAPPLPERYRQELDDRVREVTEAYESSTSWRVTRPLRAVGGLWRKWRERRGS
ncbi:MAG TPA: glycosyltransferase [Firmicutes bacterium]|nr:glycosyltransferase [Bacillota bacterium]